jgi:hypothetical protein
MKKEWSAMTNLPGAVWKQRFESLCAWLDDAKITIEKEPFIQCDERCWDAADEIYVSFGNDVVDDETKAKELFGEDNYDVYRLHRKSLKD